MCENNDQKDVMKENKQADTNEALARVHTAEVEDEKKEGTYEALARRITALEQSGTIDPVDFAADCSTIHLFLFGFRTHNTHMEFCEFSLRVRTRVAIARRCFNDFIRNDLQTLGISASVVDWDFDEKYNTINFDLGDCDDDDDDEDDDD